MKILHVLYSGLGGHGNVFTSFVNGDIHKESEYEALFNGIEDVRQTYVQFCIYSVVKWNFVKKKPGLDFKYYQKIILIIKKSNADIIFLHSSSNILPAVIGRFIGINKKKIIIRETQANNLKTKMEWVWLSLAFLLADKIVFLSDEYKLEIKRKLFWFYNKKKVTVIPNGIDLRLFTPAGPVYKQQIIIGMQSRLTPNKDYTTLLRAVGLLKDKGKNIKLKIAGDGECKSGLIILSKELKLDNIEFCGMLDESDLLKFLQSLTIYIHASFGETMSTAIMQAMACGLPIVASDVPGINNMLINNSTGILVPVKNEKLLADAIMYLLTNNATADEFAKNASQFASLNFSNITMFERYKSIIV